MVFICPGRLYAKSLYEDSDKAKDYEEWFVHPAVRDYCTVIESFGLDLRSDPVIAVIELQRDRNLLLRYSWSATGDKTGRRHIRQEVFLIGSEQCRAMLAGRFVATPNPDTKTFSVETSSGEVFDEVLTDKVAGFGMKVFARQRSDFELIKKEKQGRLPHQERLAPRMSQEKIQEGDAMFKFLSALFACGCLVGGWYYWTTNDEIGRLESELGQTKSELKSCHCRISELRRQVGDREIFERNVSNMREIFVALKKSVAEAEALMTNIEETSSVRREDFRFVTNDNETEKSVGVTNVSEKAFGRKQPAKGSKRRGFFPGDWF